MRRTTPEGSIILTSNWGFGDWAQIFSEPVVATAIVDRLLNNAVVLNIRGDSYRVKGYRRGSGPEIDGR